MLIELRTVETATVGPAALKLPNQSVRYGVLDNEL